MAQPIAATPFPAERSEPAPRAIDLPRLFRAGLAGTVLAMVLALALMDGGRQATCLLLVQAAVLLLLAGLLLRGGARGIRLPLPWWCLLGVIGLASLTSVRPEASVRELLLWLTYGGVAALTAASLREPRAWFVDGLIAVAGILCLIALYWFWGSGDVSSRWSSTFYWPNPFAAFLLLVLPLTMMRALRAASVREALAHGAMAVLFLTSLVFTYSRGAWLAGAVTLAIGAWVLGSARRRSALARFAAIAVATAAAVGLLSLAGHRGQGPTVAARAASLADPGDASARGHLLFWKNALHIFADHPLTGSGPGTFGAVHAAYQTDLRYYARDAHSLYLQTAAETGALGIVALLALILGAGLAWRRMLRRAASEEEFTLVAGLGLGVGAFLLHNAVDMDWSFPANPVMAFALAGVLGSVAIAQRAAPPPPSARQRRHILAALALVLAAVLVARMSEANRLFVQGQALASAGRWEEAGERFAQAQRWNPLNARYLGAEAEARMRRLPPQRERAEQALRRAMRLDRANAWQPLQLANVLASTPGAGPREFAEPERLLLGALRLDPINRPQIYSALARLYLAWGRAPDAAKTYEAAIRRYLGAPVGEQRVPLPAEEIDLMAEAAQYRLSTGDVAGAEAVLEDLRTDGPRATSRPSVISLSEELTRRAVKP